MLQWFVCRNLRYLYQQSYLYTWLSPRGGWSVAISNARGMVISTNNYDDIIIWAAIEAHSEI